jgi:DNA uptake protein ComE-like DNA-binding protein
MDPNMMSSMMNMMNNPEMMSQMKGMMDNPQMQDMLSNPDLMKNVMGMFGGDKEADTSADTSATLESVESAEPVESVEPVDTHKYTDSDLIVINNLTAEEYNGMCVKVISFNEVKQRYVVEIEDGKQLLVKEENLFLKNDLIEVN